MELYQSLGFHSNPFSTFSAEEEEVFLKEIYINPLFFDTLKSDIVKGHSRFILGSRGIGKTALLIRLKETIEQENVFSIIIDEFDSIPKTNNEIEITQCIIQNLVTKFCIEISKNPSRLKKLNKYQKEKFAFIIKEFFRTFSKSQTEEYYNNVTNYKGRNFARGIWNFFINRPANFALSGGIEIVSETMRKSLGLPAVDGKQFYKNYIPELTFEQIQLEKNPEKFLKNYEALKSILEDLCEIIQSTGFRTTVIFFDKIDEYRQLNSSISAVADFLESFLKDSTVLMNKPYALVFSLWDVLKPELAFKGVRFDKIKPIDITWQPENLKEILQKRVQYFSDSKKSKSDVFTTNSIVDDIIKLSNNSPRYLFRQLSYIYDQQSVLDSQSTVFIDEAISKGQLTYAKNFDYYAIYPTTTKRSKDNIITHVNRLLKIGKNIIKTKDYVDIYKVSTPTAISYIKTVQEYDLVKELTETDNGAKMYEIKDPVINYLIKSGITELKK